jgi:hypothetical protein
MYLGRTLAIAGIAYLAVHVISGAFVCYNEFCPGDRESDWVYEYTEDDGRRMIVIEGKPIDKDTYDRNLGIGKYDEDSK